MHVLILAFITALSYIVILSRIFGLHSVLKRSIIWDAVFTFGVPFLFIGTFSGMATAILAGLMFSAMVGFLGVIYNNGKTATQPEVRKQGPTVRLRPRRARQHSRTWQSRS